MSDSRLPPAAVFEHAQRAIVALITRTGFDPNEPRDPHGRWTEGGGSADAAPDKPLLISADPSAERLDRWEKQLKAQKDALDAAGTYSGKEVEEVTSMQAALHIWRNVATAEQRKSGEYGIYTVNDLDGNLLAAATTRFFKPVGIAEIRMTGGTDHDAKVKALTFTVQEYGETHRAERIEAHERNDTEHIAAFEEAGFRNTTPDQDFARMVWGAEGPTQGQIAQSEALKAQHGREILGAGKASAVFLDYPPEKIALGDEYNFAIGEKSHTAAGTAHPDGTITLYPAKIWDAKVVPGIMAHEVMHQKYRIVQAAYLADMRKIQDEPGPPPNPQGEHDWEREGGKYAVTKPDGAPRPPYDKKYPLYTDMHSHFLAMPERAKSDGVTPYSKEYWDDAYKSAAPGAQYEWSRAQKAENETLAEMASVQLETKKLPGKPAWRSYYKSINRWYSQLKSAGVAA